MDALKRDTAAGMIELVVVSERGKSPLYKLMTSRSLSSSFSGSLFIYISSAGKDPYHTMVSAAVHN